MWLVYELCSGKTMNEHLFDVKGEFYCGQRIYMVSHSNFYHNLRSNLDLLREFMYRLCLALRMFARLGIVHADLKPENILIEYDAVSQSIRSLKIIDLGSSFLLNPQGSIIQNQSEFNASTPEYLPPEVHALLSNQRLRNGLLKISDFAGIPFVFDMWALASILLEVLSGFPLWLSLKSRIITAENKSRTGQGLFGIACRDNAKILEKQTTLLKGKDLTKLLKVLGNGFDVSESN